MRRRLLSGKCQYLWCRLWFHVKWRGRLTLDFNGYADESVSQSFAHSRNKWNRIRAIAKHLHIYVEFLHLISRNSKMCPQPSHSTEYHTPNEKKIQFDFYFNRVWIIIKVSFLLFNFDFKLFLFFLLNVKSSDHNQNGKNRNIHFNFFFYLMMIFTNWCVPACLPGIGFTCNRNGRASAQSMFSWINFQPISFHFNRIGKLANEKQRTKTPTSPIIS